MEDKPLLVSVNFGAGILGHDDLEGLQENRPKSPEACVPLPELKLDGRPWDEGWRFGVDPAKALREPCVDVERKGVMLKRRDGALV